MDFASERILDLQELEEIAFRAFGGDCQKLRAETEKSGVRANGWVFKRWRWIRVDDELPALTCAGINPEQTANRAITG